MSSKKLAVLLITTVLTLAAQTNAVSRCYNFTWLGPRWNNESISLNATCQEAKRMSRGMPCMQPLIASYDGTWPDLNYIWTHHRDQATCVLAPSDVCAQFTFFFNEQVVSSTYMCARGVNKQRWAITSGCYNDRTGSSLTRVCFCRSLEGDMPCNATGTTYVSYIIYFSSLLFILINIM